MRRSILLFALFLSAAVAADDAPVFASHGLTPAVALKLAQATQAACRARDYQVTVAVVDRGGAGQVVLRDQLAGNFTFEVALRKAQTAAGFRQDTLGLAKELPDRAELGVLHEVRPVLMVGGGVPVRYHGVVIGAVGVSGAPSQEADDACARAGLEAIAEDLLF